MAASFAMVRASRHAHDVIGGQGFDRPGLGGIGVEEADKGASAIGVTGGVCGISVYEIHSFSFLWPVPSGFLQYRKEGRYDIGPIEDEILPLVSVVELEKLDGSEGAVALVAACGDGLG
jgi:hypothetical protein